MSPAGIARRLEELRALYRLACSLHAARPLAPETAPDPRSRPSETEDRTNPRRVARS